MQSCLIQTHPVHPDTFLNARMRRICIATKNARVGADMDVSAIEALTNAKLAVDGALDTANNTREEIQHEYEAVNNPAELRSIKDALHRGVRERSQRQGSQRQVGC